MTEPIDIDLKSSASEHIGKIIFEFSNLEHNINLCLQWIVQAQDFHTVNPLIERLSFKNKIDALIDIIEIKFSSNPECISEFKSWHSNLDKIRIKRNSFIHGNWGETNNKQIVNVSPAMMGSIKRNEDFYTISNLNNEILSIQLISKEFRRLRKKWHL